VEIPSLRVLIDSELEEVEWEKVRYEQLNLISEKRIAAICHHQLYQMSHVGKHPRGVPVLAMTVFHSVIGIDFVWSRHLVFN
jgi:nickel-dependent lactate racemase